MKTPKALDNYFSKDFLDKVTLLILVCILSIVSVGAFIYYYQNGLGLAYNDARSHLDIGRRVVEGLNPGIAQVGSVWLPLTHVLMALTIWNDFMWHSGLAGAIQSMIAYVATGAFIFLFLRELKVGMAGRIVGVAVFALNPNILYLQSTAMTEVMFLGTMIAGCYYFLLWYKNEKIKYLMLAAFWIMLSTLIRYDGWFLLFFATVLLFFYALKKSGWRAMEGKIVLFCSLGSLGIALWFLWNLLIFGDLFYFAFGPFSAHAQQTQLESAGVLYTKGNLLFSSKVFLYAWVYNSGIFIFVVAIFGMLALFFSKIVEGRLRYALLLLFAPLLFNVLALYLGHSVVYIMGLSGETWFNVRYGVMMVPSMAIFIGFLFYFIRGRRYNTQIILAFLFIVVSTIFAMKSEVVSIQDARFGASQKNVSEVSGWLREDAADEEGFILISAASHDSVIFASGLPMMRFIHEGTGTYYETALREPDRWARWIVVRTHSDDDSTWRAMKDNPGFESFELVDHYPFADIYKLKEEFSSGLNIEPTLH